MTKFEQEMSTNEKEQEKYSAIRDVLNEKARVDWEHIEEAMTSPEEKAANAKFESCRSKHGDIEFHDTKAKIYDEMLEKSNKSQYEGLLMNKLFFGLGRINGDVMVQVKTGNLPEQELKRLRSASYEDARELIQDIAETIGKEKAQLVLDRWHTNTEPSRDYLSNLLKI